MKTKLISILFILFSTITLSASEAKNTSVLHAVKEKTPLEHIKLLIARKGDVNEKGAHGETALIEASLQKNAKLVHLLLESDADPNASTHCGHTAYCYATPRTTIEALLLIYGASEMVD